MKKDELHIPYELLEDIRRGECLPVIGAGFSLNAKLPEGVNMPLWNDLSQIISGRLNESVSGNPIKDLSHYSYKKSRFALIDLLRDCLHVRTAKPGIAHKEFARIPFKQIVTTNFDFLLERAYESIDIPFLPVLDEDLMNCSQANGEVKIIKMHGDLHHPSRLVLTEDDYDNFIAMRGKFVSVITYLLLHNTLLFIGYSIDDPDFRQIWGWIKEYSGNLRRPAYALLVDPSPSKIDEYTRRGVTEVISLPKHKLGYGAALASEFAAICKEIERKQIKK